MYQPGRLDSSSLAALANSIRIELEKIAFATSEESDYVLLKTIYAAPKRIREGMIVKADGTTWNPGSGAGVYCYRAAAWRFLG